MAFARAIVIEPACVLFDEPLSALDAILREEMRHELREIVSRLNLTAVFVTHDQTEAMSMSDRIAVLYQGRIEQYDTPEQIYRRPATPFVAHFVGKANWFSDTKLVRPEALSLVPAEGCQLFELPVTGVQYLGDTYEIILRYNGVFWILHSSQKPAVGSVISVYIDPQNIILLQKEKT